MTPKHWWSTSTNWVAQLFDASRKVDLYISLLRVFFFFSGIIWISQVMSVVRWSRVVAFDWFILKDFKIVFYFFLDRVCTFPRGLLHCVDHQASKDGRHRWPLHLQNWRHQHDLHPQWLGQSNTSWWSQVLIFLRIRQFEVKGTYVWMTKSHHFNLDKARECILCLKRACDSLSIETCLPLVKSED